MGARFIAGTVRESNGLTNAKTNKEDTEFSFEFQSEGNTKKPYKLYAPTRDEYEVSIQIIDKAISLGCNVIVYDSWIFPTESGQSYADGKNIPIYTVGAFIKKIKSREPLETE
jgi:hypothetical protein